jgi:hypothetical protein
MLGGWTALDLIAFGEKIGPCDVVPPVILKPINQRLWCLIGFILAQILVATLDADVRLIKRGL